MEVPIASAAVSRAKLFAVNQKLTLNLFKQATFWAKLASDKSLTTFASRETKVRSFMCAEHAVWKLVQR